MGKDKTKTFYIETFGCQMNYSDTERLVGILERLGYEEAREMKSADIILFNSCSVKQQAENRIAGLGPQIIKLKKANSNLKVVLTGCMARRRWNHEFNGKKSFMNMSNQQRTKEIQNRLPWIDFVVETKDMGKLGKLIGRNPKENSREILAREGDVTSYLSYKPEYVTDFQAFVPISTGCDHFCTFCIVPFARGADIGRSSEEIIMEVLNLVRRGYKDITLLGQTVNRWINPEFEEDVKEGMENSTTIPKLNKFPMGDNELKRWRIFFKALINVTDFNEHKALKIIESKDLMQPKDFLQLLQVIDQIPGEWWTTWLSSYPNYMTDELIDFMGESTKIGHQRPYLHFALQSGSDKILKRMNRKHPYSMFKKIVKKMYDKIENLNLSTDIIVGFPTETEENFQETVAAVEECQFDMIYISEFSPRKATGAAFMEDDISHEEKESRKKYLNDEVLAKIGERKNKKLLGTKQKVLIEKVDKKGRLIGRMRNFKQIRTKKPYNDSFVGTVVDAKILGCSPWALEAEILN